jgi:hypothetical protein
MTIYISILLALALWHILWENVLAPTFRLGIQYKLFELRDKLRAMRAANAVEDDAFDYLHDSLNNAIRLLPHLTISLVFSFRRLYGSDPALQRRVAKRRELLDACPAVEVRTIEKETFEAMDKALAINCGGWIVWIVPIAVAAITASKCKELLKSLMFVPSGEVNRVCPSQSAC